MYDAFDEALPDWDTQEGSELAASIRANLVALRDILIACSGVVQGWNSAPSGGTEEQPASRIFSNGTQRVKVDLTWGTSGGASGVVTKAAFYYSSNSGSSYDPMVDIDGNYVVTLAFTASGNFNTSTWGNTP